MDNGHVVVDSIESFGLEDITPDLAGESGFSSVDDLLATAKHGKGANVYLIRFHYLAPGAWDAPAVPEFSAVSPRSRPASTLLRRIRRATPAPHRGRSR
jgi:hypothetical protein